MSTRAAGVLVGMCLAVGIVVSESRPADAVGAQVVLNELHYHPADDNPTAEFVELFNAGDAVADLSGWCIDGVGFCFSAGQSITPGGFVVVGGASFGGALSNGGERVELLDASSAVVDEVDYDDRGEWPGLADGEGWSLQRRDPDSPGDDPGNWVAGAPTRGAVNVSVGPGLLPVFEDVAHTVLPGAGVPLDVTATLRHAGTASLYYRVGFGAEVELPMTVAGGVASASIPGQLAGSLVRYRLVATEDGRTGSWPRQGDGAMYTGTTVAEAAASPLPLFEWFIDDATYTKAARDLTKRGDDGYPCVIAYDGQIFDNTLVRIKGQASRRHPKKKWKFSLPAGHELDAPGLLPVPVDEFGMHGSWSDKSFIRETLASEWMTAAGVVGTQQIFPARLEKNGSFFGLYSYVEQPDGAWRDRFGYDDEDAIVYEAGDRTFGVVMAIEDATRSTTSLRYRYGKETREYENDAELRALLVGINRGSRATRRAWIMDHVDVPQVINALAADTVIQHGDMGHKNYRLILGASGRWQMVPNDFDLSWGRGQTIVTQLLERVVADPHYPGFMGHRLAWFMLTDPVFGPMYKRRVRTLTDQLLRPEPIEARVAALTAATAVDAALDRQLWGTYGEQQAPDVAQQEIAAAYVPPRRRLLLEGPLRNATPLPAAQVATPGIVLNGVDPAPQPGAPEWVELSNPTAQWVDVSDWGISGLGFTIPPGVVIGPGRAIRFVDDITKDTHPSLGGVYAAAQYGGALADGYGTLRLVTADGDVVDELTYGTPPPPVPFVVVNEINAVSDANLPGNGADPFWGSTPTGNGKDWVELVVVSDHTDLRGWRVRVADAGAAAVEVVLPNDVALSDVRAGTIVTISEELASDLAADPFTGDWWINVQLTGFNTSNSNTQVEVRDAAGNTVFGPVGEGLNGVSGIGSDEVSQLLVAPSISVSSSSAFGESKTSSFGSPNALAGGAVQDLSGLRDPVVLGADTIAPGPVSALVATNVTGRTAQVTWNAAIDDVAVTGYRVYVNGHLETETASTTAVLTALPDGTRATFSVIAVDAGGNLSAPVAVTVPLPDATGPGPARLISTSRTRSAISVRWQSAIDQTGVSSYRVELVGRPPVTTKGRSVRFANLSSATTYEIRLTAIDRLGNAGVTVVLFVATR